MIAEAVRINVTKVQSSKWQDMVTCYYLLNKLIGTPNKLVGTPNGPKHVHTMYIGFSTLKYMYLI